MSPAPLFLALLIIITPACLLVDGPITHGLVTAVAAVSVAVVAVRMRPGEAGFLVTTIRSLIIIAAIPGLWMLIQVLPLEALGIANPIWQSAAGALGRPIAGSISVDPGATVIALLRYLSIVAIAFVAAAVAVDRRRAGRIFFVLVVATTFIALMVLAAGPGALAFPVISHARLSMDDAAIDCAGLGNILAVAAVLQSLEHRRARADPSDSAAWFWPSLAASLLAYAICCAALIVNASGATCFAVGGGGAVLAISIMIRGFRFGPWGISAIISVALIVAIALVLFNPDSQKAGLMVAFTTHIPPQMIGLTQRILTETNWTGTGAGTFDAVLPIYRDIDELKSGLIPPTTMAAIAIEMGRPFLLAILMAAIVVVVLLLRGAVRRRRDSVYPMAGAGCVATVTLLAFTNAALFSTPVAVITAAVVGVAIAQSKSRLFQ